MEEQITTSWSRVYERLDNWLDILIVNLPNMVTAVVIFSIFYFIGIKMQRWLEGPVRRLSNQKSVQRLIVNAVSLFVASLGFLLALGILNLDTVLKSLLAGAGVAGLAIGLALQGTLSNTFSGILLAIKNVINIGDWIETNGYSGKVEKIELRNTWLREADNNIVVIPNKDVLDNPFKNFGLTNQIRVILKCGVSYDEDLQSVKKIAVKAIRNRFHQDNDSEVEFYYQEFGESSINFLVRFWVDATEKLTILEAQSESIITLKEAMDKHDISIPFPTRTIEVNSNSKALIRELKETNQ